MRFLAAASTTLATIGVFGCGKSPASYVRTEAGPDKAVEAGERIVASFDADGDGDAPDGWVSILGEWKVADDSGATSGPRVLRQGATFGARDYPRIVLESLSFTNLHLSVRCRPETGAVDQACGAIVRFRDSDNYYLARGNALEDNVRFYRVIDGQRHQLATANVAIDPGTWHRLEIDAEGTLMKVSWDGKQVLETTDDEYRHGHVGLWTKADAVTAFDDFTVEAR